MRIFSHIPYNPIGWNIININIIDIETGDHINPDDVTIDFDAISGSDGKAFFNFENKAFVTARVCQTTQSGTQPMCKEGHIYLEENINKELSLMIQEGDCSYCID